MKRPSTGWFENLAVISIVALLAGPAGAEEGASSAGRPETALLEGNIPASTVVYSATDAGAADVAARVREALEAAYGVPFPAAADDEVCPVRLGPVAEAFRQRNLIVVGNVHNNRALFPLYARFLCGADGVYPGVGGYELRTVSDPWNTGGGNVIVLGGSTADGLEAAAAAFLAHVPPAVDGDARLPRLLEIRPAGELKADFARIAARLTTLDPVDPARRYAITTFFEAAHNYHWTGQTGWAERARDLIRYFNAEFETSYGVSDYSVERLFRSWEMVRESPVMTERDRRETADHLVQTALHNEGFHARGNVQRVGSTHQTAPRIGMWTAAEILRRIRPRDEALTQRTARWQERIAEYFRGAAQGFRDDTDSGGTGSISVFLRWATLAHDFGYFDSGHARAALQYQVNLNDPLGFDAGLGTYGGSRLGAIYRGFSPLYDLQLSAFVYEDPHLRWLANRMPNRSLVIYAQGDMPFRAGSYSFPAEHREERPDYLHGFTIMPLSERRYRHVLPAAGDGLPPFAQTFDKACFRGGFDATDAYLLLQGVHSGGARDGNTIARYTDQGQVWLIHNTAQVGHYYRNALFISDGLNAGTPEGAVQLDAASRFDGIAMSRTTLRGYHGTDWQRAIFWKEDAGFLVLDRAVVREPGFYTGQSVWRLPVPAVWDDERHTLRAVQEDKAFHLVASAPVAASARFEQPAGGPPDNPENPFFLRQRKAGEFAAGDVLDFQNLLLAGDANAELEWTPIRVNAAAAALRATDGRIFMAGVGGDGTEALGVSADAGLYVLTEEAIYVAGVSRLAVGGRAVLSTDEPVTARIDLADGRLWTGADGPALKAAALTWDLPESREMERISIEGVDGLRTAVADTLTSVEAADAHVNAGPAATAPDGATPLRVLRESDGAGRRGTPVEGVRIRAFGNVSGRPMTVLDGLTPFRAGHIGWEAGETAELELTWPAALPIEEIVLHRFVLGRRSEMEAARGLDEESVIGLVWSGDGFETDLRAEEQTVASSYVVEPIYKGHVQAGKVQRIAGGGVTASGVRLSIPPVSSDWRGNVVILNEIEIFSDERGPLDVHDLLAVDLDGDGRDEWIVNAGEGTLSVLDHDGRTRWQRSFHGAISGMDTGDLDGDGQREILVSSYNMYLYAFKADGRLHWKVDVSRLRDTHPEHFSPRQMQALDSGPTPFSVSFWEPEPGVRRVLMGGYSLSLCVFDARGELLQIYVPGGMFHRAFLRETRDFNGNGLQDKVMHVTRYGAVGSAYILLAGEDGLIAGHRETRIPDNKPYASGLLGPERTLGAFVTPVGFGVYDLAAHFPDPVRVDGNALWEIQGGRPLSAGLLHDLTGDGIHEILAAGDDGFLGIYTLDGILVENRMIGEEIRALAALGAGEDLDLFVVTASGIHRYDARGARTGFHPGRYQKIRPVDPENRILIAVTEDARLQWLQCD